MTPAEGYRNMLLHNAPVRFEAEVVCADAIPAEVVRERTYGVVRVTADWGAFQDAQARVAVVVSGDVADREVPAYVELFFHDVFLLLNLATPGSFEGVVTTTGGAFRVHELRFDARAFTQVSERVPLETVVAWYDRLGTGTSQIAATPEAKALFHLLQLAREEEDEERSILRLAGAAEALGGAPESLRRLFELREEIARGRAPVFHPMHDDALDPRVEDATAEWMELADAAAAFVVGALQERARALPPRAHGRA
jgi:hypothetical protein